VGYGVINGSIESGKNVHMWKGRERKGREEKGREGKEGSRMKVFRETDRVKVSIIVKSKRSSVQQKEQSQEPCANPIPQLALHS
jgi:hypothetical protein